MTNNENKLGIFTLLIMLGAVLWNAPIPHGLEPKAWHIFITFIITIIAIIVDVMPIGITTLTSVAILVLTNTLTLKEALSGFSSPIAWLVLIAFFIATGFIKTNLGNRIAYMLISKFGKSNIGLSYSLIFTEFILSPMIPSTSARGGGIIYPIAKSLAGEYDKTLGKGNATSRWLIITVFHTNVICCALFLTSMSGNPLIASLAQSIGVKITWTDWAMASIVPGLINLLLLPFVTSFLLPQDSKSNESTRPFKQK
jgi:DASS family divalent anion:Na+ symporter